MLTVTESVLAFKEAGVTTWLLRWEPRGPDRTSSLLVFLQKRLIRVRGQIPSRRSSRTSLKVSCSGIPLMMLMNSNQRHLNGRLHCITLV